MRYLLATACTAGVVLSLARSATAKGLPAPVALSETKALLVAGGQLKANSVAPIEDGGPAGVPVESAAAHYTPSASPRPQLSVANKSRLDDKRSKLATGLTNPIVVSASSYRVRSGENFAEIRVHRSTQSDTDTPFVWWTEADSAKPGIDYVPQDKVTQSFPKRKVTTSFFVKLVPNVSRPQPEVFYIAIADARRPFAFGQIARASVWLPMSDNRSAAVAARGGDGSPVGLLSRVKPASLPAAGD